MRLLTSISLPVQGWYQGSGVPQSAQLVSRRVSLEAEACRASWSILSRAIPVTLQSSLAAHGLATSIISMSSSWGNHTESSGSLCFYAAHVHEGGSQIHHFSQR